MANKMVIIQSTLSFLALYFRMTALYNQVVLSQTPFTLSPPPPPQKKEEVWHK